MAYIQRRIGKDGVETFRVGWRRDGRQEWSPAIWSGEGAEEMKSLVERLGPEAALRTLARRSGRDLAGSSPLLREWFVRYQELRAGEVTPGTIDDDRRMAARTWLPRLGDMPLDTITREDVEEWVAWQRRQPTARQPKDGPRRTYSAKSIANAHGLLSAVLSKAVEHGKGITVNVARGVGLPSDDADAEMETFTAEEWSRFIAAMGEHYAPLTRFLLVVGCRIGEATALKVKDVDLDARTVRIRRAWKKGERDGRYLGATKTKRGKRTVLVSDAIVRDLRQLVEGKDADALVFVGPRGARIYAQHYRNRQWQAALTKAKITKHLTPHSLRHTSASMLLADGVSPIVVQHRLGHESLSTTSKVYAHLLTDEQIAAAQVMERALGTLAIEA